MTSLSTRLAALAPDQRDQFASRLGSAADTLAAEPLAVIGMGARLPGGVNGPDDFWDLLAAGRDAIGPVPADRWDAARFGEPGMRAGGFLDDVAGFDADFFGVAPREAAAMDPQARLLLEVAWEALEHAGIRPRSLAGSATGVFAGVFYNDYLFRGLRDLAAVDAYNNVGGAHSGTVGRLSYLLDLAGPAVAVDSACSSSLVALHQACQSLRLRESDLALVGGTSLVLDPGVSLSLARFGVLSAGGRCRTFDAGADGIVRSEGCGVVVLKRFTDALRDGDRVLALVRGSAVNTDGRSQGLTAPSGRAQRNVIIAALRQSGVTPGSVGLIETHGTGTSLGDPIEVEALAGVYGPGSGRAALGAVKTNLGHTEAAAGVVSLIKAVLCLRRGEIPANLHLRRPNPDLRLAGTRFFLPAQTVGWPVDGGPRTAAVSAFGMGGTNAHVVLEEAVPEQAPAAAPVPAATGPTVLTVSGATAAALAATAGRLRAALAAGADLAGAAATLAHRRTAHPHRAALVGAALPELLTGLDALAAGAPAPGLVTGVATATGTAPDGPPPGPVLVFAGHGSQWTGMGRELLAAEPAFAAAVDELAPVLDAEGALPPGVTLRAALTGTDLAAAPADLVQPLVYAVQIGLVAVLRSYGVTPAAVVGHSMGEIAAAVAAGALTAADGARLICRRSALLRRVAGRGAMALVTLPAAETETLIAGRPGLSVAIHAAPAATVVAGDPAAIDEFVAVGAGGGGAVVRRVASDVAFHSPQLAPLAAELAGLVGALAAGPPRTRLYSTSAADPRGVTVLDGPYWARNLREPVRFAAAVAAAAADGHRVFVEVSPHPVVATSVSETLAADDVAGTVVAPLRRDSPAGTTLRTALAALHCAGAAVDLDRLVPPGPLTDLPTNAWEHTRYWLDAVSSPAVSSPSLPTPPGPTRATTPPAWVHRLDWPECPPVAVTPPGDWLVIGDAGDVGAVFAARVERAGGTAAVVPAADLTGLDDAALAARLGPLSGVRGVLTCAALVGSPDLDSPDFGAGARVRRTTLDLVRLARVVAAAGGPRLFVATAGAQPVGDPAAGGRIVTDPAAAALWGLGRGLAVELPAGWGGLVDLDPDADASAAADALLAEATAADGEDQTGWRGGRRYAPRVVPAAFDTPDPDTPDFDTPDFDTPDSGTDHDRDPDPASAGPASPGPALDPAGAHLVVGATGTVGPYLLARLADLGARHLVLVSRRGAGGVADGVRDRGVTVTDVTADVADEAAMAALVARFGTELPPLRSVWNAALAGGDAEVARLTAADLDAVLRAKVDGTVLLDRLTAGADLQAFVLFSSTTALLGTRGLAHYGAACAFLDAYAIARGSGTRVVNFGALATWFATTGATAATADRATVERATVERATVERASMDGAGMRPMDDAAAVAALGPMVTGGAVARIVAAVDWERLAAAYRATGPARILDVVAPPVTAARDVPGELAGRVRAADPAARRRLVTDHVRTVVADVMGFPSPRSLGPSAGFFQLGMDSLMSMRAQSRLATELDVELAPADVFNHPTVDALSEHLLGLLPPPAARQDDDTQGDDEDDLARRLSARLEALR